MVLDGRVTLDDRGNSFRKAVRPFRRTMSARIAMPQSRANPTDDTIAIRINGGPEAAPDDDASAACEDINLTSGAPKRPVSPCVETDDSGMLLSDATFSTKAER